MQNFSFVLIPGAGGDAWYWHLLAPKLEDQGYGTIPVNLPAADNRAGLPEYTGAVVGAMQGRDPKRMAIVAQSIGGFTAPLVCEKVPVALLVLLNAMIPRPGETPGQWWGNTGHAEAKRKQNLRDGRSADAFDPLIDFFHDVPQPVIDSAWARGEPRQSEAVFDSPCTIKAWPVVTTHVLVGKDDRFLPVDFQLKVARERLGVSGDLMPGGHLVALSQPSDLAERLIAYVEART